MEKYRIKGGAKIVREFSTGGGSLGLHYNHHQRSKNQQCRRSDEDPRQTLQPRIQNPHRNGKSRWRNRTLSTALKHPFSSRKALEVLLKKQHFKAFLTKNFTKTISDCQKRNTFAPV